MSILSDRWIRKMATRARMINPFSEKQVREGVISYGLSSYGYDLRVADEFKIFTNVNSTIVDPKKFDERSFVSLESDVCIVPPNSFALARSVEYFKIPRDVLTICVGKSTYARCGIIVNVTPFEPEWEGFVTLEISNTTPLPARIYANEGLCQILFFQGKSLAKSATRTRRANTRTRRESCCRNCRRSNFVAPRKNRALGAVSFRQNCGCALLPVALFVFLVHVLNAGLIDQQIRLTIAVHLQAILVVPLDDAVNLFIVLQHQDHRRLGLHLLLVVEILGVGLLWRRELLRRSRDVPGDRRARGGRRFRGGDGLGTTQRGTNQACGWQTPRPHYRG